MKMCKFFFIFYILFVLSSNHIFAASISGRVSFKDGRPVPNLKIISESLYFTHVTYTNDLGIYKFILSNELHTSYHLFICLNDGRRFKFGHITVIGNDHTMDVQLTINNLDN